VSLPELSRIRSILRRDDLLVVVQDIFLTETAQLADVVLPAATWGEKAGHSPTPTGPCTCPRKRSTRPVMPAPDLEIFLDFARRMDFRDKDGARCSNGPTPSRHMQPGSAAAPGARATTAASATTTCAAQAATKGGGEGLYANGDFRAKPDDCESYGRDLVTGASVEETEYRALNPDTAGR
jgi:anaerobic selenocysteine-containing dehydrogenase